MGIVFWFWPLKWGEAVRPHLRDQLAFGTCSTSLGPLRSFSVCTSPMQCCSMHQCDSFKDGVLPTGFLCACVHNLTHVDGGRPSQKRLPEAHSQTPGRIQKVDPLMGVPIEYP